MNLRRSQHLAASICGAPISLISLVDRERQWFKAKVGLDAREVHRDLAFCGHAILKDEVMVVEDARKDERFHDNPLVTGDPNIRFYAGAPIMAPNGLPLGSFCVIDREPRKLTKDQAHALQVLAKQVVGQLELRASLEKERRQAEELKQANAMKDKFFGIIAHDLRAPFNGMIGLSRILHEEWEDLEESEKREIVKDLFESSQGGFHLLENLLKWALCETGRMSHEPGEIMLSSVVDDVWELLGPMAAAKEIDWCTGGLEIKVFADERMLTSTIQNLVSNAIKFTPKGGRVALKAERNDEAVVVSVVDSGVGIEPDRLEKLFDLETATSTTGTDDEQGTGLGLKLCKEFVERNGGSILVESSQDGGTQFRFTIPLVTNS